MIRHFEMTMDEIDAVTNNRLGVKGVGELGTIGATPAVVNAVRRRARARWPGRARRYAADAVYAGAGVARVGGLRATFRSRNL